jgi:hypothetical protein
MQPTSPSPTAIPSKVLPGILDTTLPPTTDLSSNSGRPTETPTPKASETMVASMTLPTRTVELTRLLTFTYTPTPHWTPLPKLDQSARRQLILDLLNNNAGCRLPCWWGITPGETSWAQAEHFLESFAEKIYEVPKDEKTNLLGERSLTLHLYAVEYETPDPESLVFTGTRFGVIGIGVENGLVSYITSGDASFAQYNNTPHYLLPHLLEIYGVPTEVIVYVETGGADLMEFWIGAMYEQGIIAQYDYDLNWADGQYRACPQYVEPSLSLWAPNDQQLLAMFVGDMKRHLGSVTLQQATGMNLETFYETFKNPDNTTCLYSPMTLWP